MDWTEHSRVIFCTEHRVPSRGPVISACHSVDQEAAGQLSLGEGESSGGENP
jgi:hypothetical protein